MSLFRCYFFISVLLTGLLAQGGWCGDKPVPPERPHSARPFPQHVTYREGCILPSHVSRERMDDSVRAFYKAWKQRYIRRGCNEGEYYVWFEGPDSRNKQCVSEGQGYGMIITALMAGYDTAA